MARPGTAVDCSGGAAGNEGPRQISAEICHQTGRSVFPLYYSVTGTSSETCRSGSRWGGRCPPQRQGFCVVAHRLPSRIGQEVLSFLRTAHAAAQLSKRLKPHQTSPQAISHDPEAGWNGIDGTNGNSICSITATDTPPLQCTGRIPFPSPIPLNHSPYPLHSLSLGVWRMSNEFEKPNDSNSANGSALHLAVHQRTGRAHDQLLTAGAIIVGEGQRFDGQGESMARRRYQKGRVVLRGKAHPVWVGR
jgi:hypothetical protein